MSKNSDIAIENINEGDIYYFRLNSKYFFLQILKVVTGLPEPYDIDFKYGFYLAIFQKTYFELPKKEDLEFSTVYVTKHYTKNTACYFSIWDKEPHIKFKKQLLSYDLKDKYVFEKFDNRAVKPFEKFKPPLVPQFSMPANTNFHNGIQNTHKPVSIQFILTALESEEIQRGEKKKNITPIYFKEWLDYINADAIVKTEKALLKFQQKEGRSNVKENALTKCIEMINKIDIKHSHIGTIEREDLFEKLMEISETKEIELNIAERIINENREW